MTSSSLYPSSILNIPISRTNSLITPPHKISFLDNPLSGINSQRRKCSRPIRSSSDSTTTVEAEISSNSVSEDGVYDEEAVKAQAKIGAKVRVKVPLKVYHVPKVPEFELNGQVGILKQYVGVHKGKKISANLPYKVEFVVDNIEGRSGPVKFLAHLREDEFEYLD
ncbi:OLC1v1001447C1 [Oldenlandia corymbosa var. corymbosa]|uniref:OLC1v1001447C1 n=1 Tax=Oldenlandia corymbosa var. corymbosa TaxID=529605 RepID=A0AAV1D8R5_OLDCO|nr:OLC1v1001447C1 [Oldenlandia corymbosa var. corymbosa]